MEKNMYPQMPELTGAGGAPPTYNQTIVPSAPAPQEHPSFNSNLPQPSPMHQQPQQHPLPVYIQSEVRAPLGPRSCLYTCHNCHQQQMTKILYESSSKTHLFAALLCVLGLICCVCCPYCIDSCKNTNHYCSNCNTFLGTYLAK